MFKGGKHGIFKYIMKKFMYKLIAIDLDGTLLNSYGQISPKNKQAVQSAIQKGAEVVLTSGRGIMSVKNLADEVNANNYIICGNGAMVYDVKKENLLYSNFLSQKKVLQLIQICDENSIYYSVYTKNGIITIKKTQVNQIIKKLTFK